MNGSTVPTAPEMALEIAVRYAAAAVAACPAADAWLPLALSAAIDETTALALVRSVVTSPSAPFSPSSADHDWFATSLETVVAAATSALSCVTYPGSVDCAAVVAAVAAARYAAFSASVSGVPPALTATPASSLSAPLARLVNVAASASAWVTSACACVLAACTA